MSDVAREARATGSSLRKEASGLGSTIKQGLSDQVERQKNGIADRLSVVAERVQRTAGDLREQEAWLGSLLGRGAAELEGIADEIRRNDVPGILGSVEVFARRQPALFMGATVALGFALTRFVGGGPVAGCDDRPGMAEAQRRGQSGVGMPGYGPPPMPAAARPAGASARPVDTSDGQAGATSDADGAGQLARSASCCAIWPATSASLVRQEFALAGPRRRTSCTRPSPPPRSWWSARWWRWRR